MKDFFQETVPELVKAVNRLADRLTYGVDPPAAKRMYAGWVADLCETCLTAPVPGALWPVDRGSPSHIAYVEACDTCGLFSHDTAAAVAVAATLGREVSYDAEGHACLSALSCEDAAKLAKKLRRSTAACVKRRK